MAYTRHLLPKLNFILTRATGIVDDASLLIHLMNFRIECKKYEFIREFVDLRDVKKDEKVTVQGLIRIAETHKGLFPKKEFLSAVLVNNESRGKMLEFYSTLVTSPKLRVKVFAAGTDHPLAWLGYKNGDVKQIKKFIGKYSDYPE